MQAAYDVAAKLKQVGINHPMFGKHHTKMAKEKIGETSKEHWNDPQFREKTVRAQVKASFIRPTSAELILQKIINQVCPNEYLYNGDGKLTILGSIPDFINVNGQKKVIEMFGDYWHSQDVIGKSESDETTDKINKHAKLGYDCLIIWERELKNYNNVSEKIVNFHSKEHARPKDVSVFNQQLNMFDIIDNKVGKH